MIHEERFFNALFYQGKIVNEMSRALKIILTAKSDFLWSRR